VSLKAIALQNYRTYAKASAELSGINVLIGANTQGKTNFLEAISYLTFGKSFRSSDRDLIKWGEDFFRIEATTSENKKIEVFYSLNPQKKMVRIDNQAKKQSELFGHNLAVLFSPEDINLIAAPPEKKRRYLDMIISQVDKLYLVDLISYKKILKQRNSLLLRIREGSGGTKELEVWSEKLVERGLPLIQKRHEFFIDFEEDLKKAYRNFGEQDLWLKFVSSTPNSKEGFEAALKKAEATDIVSAKTSLGPHRDDFVFYLEDKEIESIGSRGEFRSAVLALKLAEIKYLEKKTGKKAIFLLDDVFSELDESRRDALYNLIGDYQTIITSTDLDHLSEELLKKAAIFKIENYEIINQEIGNRK